MKSKIDPAPDSPSEDSLYIINSPRDLLNYYRKYPIPELSFFCLMMNCVLTHPIGEVVRCIPVNLFDQFKEMITGIASLSRDEDFIVIGHPVRWHIKDARRVVEWMGDHPNPELALRL